MSKPRLLILETLGDFKGNEKLLLREAGYKTIYEAKKTLWDVSNKARDIYNFLLKEYNRQIEKQNKRSKQLHMEKLIVWNEQQLQQKVERKNIIKSLKKIKEDITARKSYLKQALNGTFKEQVIYVDEIPALTQFETPNDVKDSKFLQQLLAIQIKNELKNAIKYEKKTSLNVFIVIKCLMAKTEENPDYDWENAKSAKYIEIIREHYYNAPIRAIVSENNIQQYVNDVLQGFLVNIEASKNGSDWYFKSLVSITIGSNRVKSVLGKSYIKLPPAIQNKKACLNIKNNDNKCFDWCLIANLMYDSIKGGNKSEVRHYKPYESVITKPKNVEYPITTDQILDYEELNDTQINVIKLENYTDEVEDVKTCLREVYKSNQHRKKVVNILLIEEGENSHYVLIRNLSRLFTSKTNHKTKFICPHCLTKSFLTNELLDNHINSCANYSESEKKVCDVNVCMPLINIMKFENRQNKFKHPFHVVADFESTLTSVDDDIETSTKKYQKHLQNSFGLKFCSIHKEHDEDVKIFSDADPEEVNKHFVEELERCAKKAYEMTQLFKFDATFRTESEELKHKNTTNCGECNILFPSKEDDDFKKHHKVMHHDHITGEFISSLCNKCNLAFQVRKFLPVYIHNLKGYDAHLFINSLSKYGQKTSSVSCIPNNEERYISFSKEIKVGEYRCKKTNELKPIMFEIRFLDSIAFMNSSIDSLVSNLRKDCNTDEDYKRIFPNSSKHFTDIQQLKLMTQKGVYPYDYIDSFNKLNRTSLPPRKAFYSRLYDSECSKQDYLRAKLVWKTFKCKSFLDYHNLYLKSDVLTLADIIQNFRDACYKNYELDFCYYYTAPGLSFDAMLKHTGIELELLDEEEMYEFCESGIRGGLSQISTRHAKANNKYMKVYDPTKQDSYIVYLDANNLYGWAMSQFLPYKDFKWNNDMWTKEKILNLANDAETGYMFKVDLRIPEHLHDYFNNYVPCPENVKVDKNDLNQFQQEGYKNSQIRKLCCSFKDRIDYVVNYRYLKLALSLGVELLEVKQVLQFSQKPFLKEYIELNTNLRKKAKNEFEKDFFKLMNNSVFGKTMENVRSRINFRLVSTEDQAWRVKNLNRFTIFSENLVGVHIQKKEIHLNKPVYLGQTILDDSKYLMYDFHYNFMLKKIPREDLDLCMTDTDSLFYSIRKHDIYKIMKENKDYFDLSEYPVDHELYDPINKKVIGKFKPETLKPVTEFVGLRAKLYAYSVDEDEDKHLRAKGVKRCVANRELNIDLYRNVLFNRNTHSVKQNGIRSYGHQLYTEQVSKIALSGNDDKVYICDDNIHTYNFGHYKTKA